MPYLESYSHRGIGADDPDLLSVITSPVKSLVSKSAEGMDPVIRQIVKDEIMPKVILALLGVGILAALIGSAFASRRCRIGTGGE